MVGDCNVDIVGYVTGLDGNKLMSLKDAMALPEASDDEDYRESGESEESNESEEQEEDEEHAEVSRDAVDFNQPVAFERGDEE